MNNNPNNNNINKNKSNNKMNTSSNNNMNTSSNNNKSNKNTKMNNSNKLKKLYEKDIDKLTFEEFVFFTHALDDNYLKRSAEGFFERNPKFAASFIKKYKEHVKKVCPDANINRINKSKNNLMNKNKNNKSEKSIQGNKQDEEKTPLDFLSSVFLPNNNNKSQSGGKKSTKKSTKKRTKK